MTGDSITRQFNTKLWLKEFNITNSGVSGNNTSDLLERIYKDVIAPQPDIVFLLIGTNDLAQGRGIDYIAKNILKITETVKTRLPKCEIYVSSILPTLNNDPRPNPVIRELNELIKNNCESSGVKYLDLMPMFRNSKGELKKEYTYDGLHLNEAGYKAWAEFLRPLLLKIS